MYTIHKCAYSAEKTQIALFVIRTLCTCATKSLWILFSQLLNQNITLFVPVITNNNDYHTWCANAFWVMLYMDYIMVIILLYIILLEFYSLIDYSC